MVNISVIVPLYNEEESLPELAAWIRRVTEQHSLSCEVIMVDDGSTDGSWSVVQRLAQDYGGMVRGIRFQRNYGKAAALFQGFEAAQGEVVVTMDADLQDSPDELPEFYRMVVEDGYDVVSGWKKKRYDPIEKRLPSKLFNATARLVTGIRLHDFNCGLKAYRRKVVKSIEVYGEMHRYIPVLAKQAGFKKIGEKAVQHQARKFGVSKFGWERYMNGFLDLLSVVFITRFGKKPMHFFGVLGTLMFLIGLAMAIYLGAAKIKALSNGIPAPLVANSPYFYIGLTVMVMGTLLFLAGYLGELIVRSSGDRNHYLVEERT
ncbi:MAG: glycosyltransferase family 2 protein [Prevotellaceae bacterium]|jgi:glycosyltransferase involved in cell wall biosynthesis|nr:glycosyltransferase family 2 protein [Prevotellaceae bacterium]